jgi:hypothetical protein
MNILQQKALTRLVQIFKLKLMSFESYKSVFVLDILLDIMMKDTLDKRYIIISEILVNLRISRSGDLCWM